MRGDTSDIFDAALLSFDGLLSKTVEATPPKSLGLKARTTSNEGSRSLLVHDSDILDLWVIASGLGRLELASAKQSSLSSSFDVQ